MKIQNQYINLKTGIIYIIVSAIFCSCATTSTRNDATIGFDQTEFNFGKLQFKKEAECSFKFYNTGTNPLIIYDVKISCGCTAADWTKKPVKSGNSGEITIKYDSAFPGMFNKVVTVYFNGQGSPVILKIKGQVENILQPEEQ